MNRLQRTQHTQAQAGRPATLALGARGPAVEHLQRMLNHKGAHLAVDGDFGANTQAALQRFQKSCGLAADGVAGAHTMRALQQGATGPHAAHAPKDELIKGGHAAGRAPMAHHAPSHHAHTGPKPKRGLAGAAHHVKAAVHHGISAAAHKEMRALLAVAERGAAGKRPEGRCLEAVQNYLDKVTFGHGKVPRLPFARNYAEFLNRDGNAAKLGLKRLAIHNPYDAPPGAIVVVRAGTPGTHHPTAGDIVVRGHGQHLYNDGEMGYGGSGNFPKGNNFVLGVYIPA